MDSSNVNNSGSHVYISDNDNNGNMYGYLFIQHNGWYVARFYIYWDEPTIVGNRYLNTQKSWEFNGNNFTAPYFTTVPIPSNATNICIKAEGSKGIGSQNWYTILDYEDLSMVPKRTLKLWGTSLDQHGSLDPKSSNSYDSSKSSYGNLIIQHKGWYIARFYIYWTEPTTVGDSIVTTQKSWSNNGESFTAPYYTTIPIPLNAYNINIIVEGETGLVWQLWNTILNQKDLSMISKRTIILWGTSLDQHASLDPL